jgi:hypothetical protein
MSGDAFPRDVLSSVRGKQLGITAGDLLILNRRSGGQETISTVLISSAQQAAPTAEMLADVTATYQLNTAPHTRYQSDGASLVTLGGGGGANLTNITSAALAALTAGTVSATTLYRVTDGSYRDTVYIYDTTSDTLHPIGIPPSAYGY